jgi:4-hydroxybenzoate polyprenyltransferase
MKRSERYYQESRRQLLLAVACFAATLAICMIPFFHQLGFLGIAVVIPLIGGIVYYVESSLETRRLAKQSEQAEINRAIRPRL